MTTRHAALLSGLIPLIAIHVAYLLAAGEGHVPWCMPYIDSCTSISATGRHGLAYWWFKATMIPAALVMIVFWWRIPRWLGERALAIGVAGVIAGLCLVLYTLALGEAGELFQIQRRIGATLYFTLTYLAQLLFVARLRREARLKPTLGMWFLCLLALGIGLFSLGLDAFTDWQDEVEDAIEWQLALIINSWFFACFLLLKSKPQRTVNSAPN